MLSTVPAFSFTEPGLVNQFPGFQTGFTPLEWDWDCSNFFSVNQSCLEPVLPSPCFVESDTGSVRINSGLKTGSDESCAGSIKVKPGSNVTDTSQADEPDSIDKNYLTAIANSGSVKQNHNRNYELNQQVLPMNDEKKRKRMESNRESARRSRMRKQTHIENLQNQVNRLDLENRELLNRLRLVLYQIQRVNTDNNQLVTEQEILRRRLSDLRQILILQQWEQNRSSITNHQMI